MTILPLSLVSCLALHQADPEESVIAGREALDGWLWSRYPWYDSHTDGMRRIDVSDSWFADWFEALLDSIGAFFRISWLKSVRFSASSKTPERTCLPVCNEESLACNSVGNLGV